MATNKSEKRQFIGSHLLILVIRSYQKWISPLLNPSCRFEPTCSQYAIESLKRFGAVHGSWLTLKRILKCHPLNKGGYDPIPPNK